MKVIDAINICQAVFDNYEKIKSLFDHDSSQLLALFCSELEQEVDVVWLDLTALIPSVNTFLEACIQLANFCDNYIPPSSPSRSASASASGSPATSTISRLVQVVGSFLSSWWVTPATPDNTSTVTCCGREDDFKEGFDRLLNTCNREWKPIQNRIEAFLGSKLKPLVEKCLLRRQQAIELKMSKLCQCKCCSGLGVLATASATVVVGTILVPEKLPAAIIEVVPEMIMKYPWWAVLALILLGGVCIYAAYSTWMCQKECQQIDASLTSVRDKVNEMEILLGETRRHGESCIAIARQVRNNLDSELKELMKQIRNNAMQLKDKLKKVN